MVLFVPYIIAVLVFSGIIGLFSWVFNTNLVPLLSVMLMIFAVVFTVISVIMGDKKTEESTEIRKTGIILAVVNIILMIASIFLFSR